MNRPTFPIDSLLPQLQRTLQTNTRLVLEAPPGAGKTTQIPLALLRDAGWLQGRRIVMLEPRRVAARSAAAFMARQLGEEPGETVGYRIRFENRVSERTRIEVVTEGILTRMIQDDPSLEGIGALLFDEFHERHLSADLGLALALDVQAQLRGDLRILVMSATLDGAGLARWLEAPRLSGAGRGFPVHIEHFPTRRDESPEMQTRRAVEHALSRHPGDVLVFLPGRREIARVQAALERSAAAAGLADILALHGELPIEQQARALQPDPEGRRRVVLATNVAESSVTLPGVRIVIDSGLAREPRFDPNSGFPRLDVVAISQASADQRAGRAGRIADGWAYRLWPASQRLEAQRRPEIMQAELSGFALELAAWGSDALHFVDPPPKGALAAARDLLQRLGAFDGPQRMTTLGKRILRLGTHARLASLLLSARGDEQALACDLVALLEARDPLPGGGDALATRWRALAAFRRGGSPAHGHRSALSAIDNAARQWRRRLHCDAAPPSTIEAHALGDLLAHAFPDRIAAQHPHDPRRYLLANGRSARTFEDSALFGERWLVISDLRHEARDALILRAAPVDEIRLREDFPARFMETRVTRWDTEKRALICVRESRFDRIVLASKPAGRPDAAQAARALTDAVRELGLEVLPWTDSLRQWRARAQSLRHWAPELELPDLSDPALIATLESWLSPAFSGLVRLDALNEERLADALKSPLEWPQRQQIDRWVPARIEVPSGMDRRIDYAIDSTGEPQPPILAVKLQELFGLADTPRIADGRVPLTLHLLSPAGRPLQVTQDLRGFWERTYPEVKKEMKGRYPKHPWPDDPWTATATHRAKPRGT